MHTYIRNLIKHKDDEKLCNVIATVIAFELFEAEDIDFEGWKVETVDGIADFGDLTEIQIFLVADFAHIGLMLRIDNNCTLISTQACVLKEEI